MDFLLLCCRAVFGMRKRTPASMEEGDELSRSGSRRKSNEAKRGCEGGASRRGARRRPGRWSNGRRGRAGKSAKRVCAPGALPWTKTEGGRHGEGGEALDAHLLAPNGLVLWTCAGRSYYFHNLFYNS